MKTVRASGTYTTESLCVCAGPRSVTSMFRPPTVSDSDSVNVRSGLRPSTSPNSKSPNA